MKTEPLLAVHLTLGPTQKLGAGPKGDSVIFPLTGGTFEGPKLRGKVLPGGADWALLRPDGAMEIDLRLTLQAEDGALIYMTFQGLRLGPPEAITYFRSVARFETAAPQYAFLNRLLAIGSGKIENGLPTHTFEAVL
jgi:hypothetical protein